MGEIGVLACDARLEPIEGDVIDMEPRQPRPASATTRLSRLLREVFVEDAVVPAHGPLSLFDHSQPDPT